MHVLKEATLLSSDVATVDTMMKLTALRIVGAGILMNILSSRRMVMINDAKLEEGAGRGEKCHEGKNNHEP